MGTLVYDPPGRLYETSGGVPGTVRFLYDGDELVGEYSSTGTLLRRYVHGAGVDDPIAWYEGAALTARRHLLTNEQGSVNAVTDSAGALIQAGAYSEYGVPNTANLGRFGYTGQIWLPELALSHYKARAYSPWWGRFLQTDPVGYDDQVNLYAYVGNDPVNATDPTGTQLWDPIRGAQAAIRVIGEAFREDPVGATITTVGIVIDVVNTPLSPGPDATIIAGGVNAARAASKADFVVTRAGTTVPKSQSAMEAGFKKAGIEGRNLGGKGREYTLPNGNHVRAMEPQAQGAGRRVSFTNSARDPVSPDGKPVQPPRGTTDTKSYVRDRTHIEQEP